MTFSLTDRIAEALRAAAAEAVLPRFRALAAHEVEQKGPDDPVTIADREAEAILQDRLAAIVPAAGFVGEEACARDPALLARLGSGWCWLVDPIDGTRNFAAGRAPFAMMASLLREGEIVAAAILDPLTDRIVSAEQGAGARMNGLALRTPGDAPTLDRLCGVVSGFARPPEFQESAERVEHGIGEALPTLRCAGAEYPMVALGERHFALYWRTLAWDHAAGVLLLNEAGGVAERPDGSRYRPTEPGTGMLVAQNRDVAEQVRAVLTG